MAELQLDPSSEFEAKIDTFLRQLMKDTGAVPVIAMKYPGDAGFFVYGILDDTPGFIAELYDSVFPSLIDEVNNIKGMGTEALRTQYLPADITDMIDECNELQDEKLRIKLQDILLEALDKLSVTALRRKKK